MLALSGRLSADVQKARELVASGAIGKLYGVEMHFLADQTRLARKDYAERVGWTLEKARAGGGHLVWLGIHYLDQMMFITDSSVSQVSGFPPALPLLESLWATARRQAYFAVCCGFGGRAAS